MSKNLYDLFRGRFPADLGQPFIETVDGHVFTYGDLDEASGRIANLLTGLGVSPGDRVAGQVEKSPQAVFIYLACLRAGAAYVPLNTAYRRGELEYFFSDAKPTVVVCRAEFEAETKGIADTCGVVHVLTLDEAGGGSLTERSAGLSADFATIERRADDLAAVLYTSGTTGRAKGAMLSHDNLAANALTLHKAWGWKPGDVLLHILPVFHTHGLFVAIHCVLLNGSPMLFMGRFDADDVIKLLPRATVMMGVPTHYTRLLAAPGFTAGVCRNMRLFISGSAPLLSETFHAFEERTGYTILERCGMTETGMNTSNPLDGDRIAGTVGLALPGVEARVTDDDGTVLPVGDTGVLEIRGPNVFKGYWQMPEKTAEEFRSDGFFITGDIARIDDKGYVTIVGRAKDLIITGGFNVYPKEIELLIDEMDGVDESAVIGLPHPDFGEAVGAVIKSRDKGLDGETITGYLKDTLANFKVPKRIYFVDELPRNSMGKVQKNMLREQYKDTFTGSS